MKELIGEFLNYLTVEKGLSKNTILAYGADLNHFAAHLEGLKISSIDRIKRQDIIDYLLKLKDPDRHA